MPRPVPPTGTCRVAVSGTASGHRWVNVFTLKLTDDGTQTVADLNTIIDGLLASYNTRFSACMSGAVAGVTGDAAWQTSPTTQLAVERTHAIGPSGVQIDDASACTVVRWKIAARYRGGKPRTYLPIPEQGNVTNGSDLSSAYQTTVVTNAQAFMNDVNALVGVHVSQVQLGTISWFTARGSLAVPPVYRTPPIFEAFTGAGVNPKLGTQRRRIHS